MLLHRALTTRNSSCFIVRSQNQSLHKFNHSINPSNALDMTREQCNYENWMRPQYERCGCLVGRHSYIVPTCEIDDLCPSVLDDDKELYEREKKKLYVEM